MMNDDFELEWELKHFEDLSACWWALEVTKDLYAAVEPCPRAPCKFYAYVQHDDYVFEGPPVKTVEEAKDIAEDMISQYVGDAIKYFLDRV